VEAIGAASRERNVEETGPEQDFSGPPRPGHPGRGSHRHPDDTGRHPVLLPTPAEPAEAVNLDTIRLLMRQGVTVLCARHDRRADSMRGPR